MSSSSLSSQPHLFNQLFSLEDFQTHFENFIHAPKPQTMFFVGLATLDHIWYVEHLPSGDEKIRANAYRSDLGGMATNAAITAQHLYPHAQLKTHLCTRFGDDQAQKELAKLCAHYQLDTRYSHVYEGMHTSTSSVVTAHLSGRTVVNYPAHLNYDLPIDPTWVKTCFEQEDIHIVQADTRWPKAAQMILQYARQHGIPTVLDIEKTSTEILHQLLPWVDHAIFSTSGLRQFLNLSASISATFYEVAAMHQLLSQIYHQYQNVSVGVTCGERGVYVFDRVQTLHFPAYDIQVMDSNGAGDAFHGAFTWAIMMQATLPQAIAFASRTAALKCLHAGRVLLSAKDVFSADLSAKIL